MFYSNAIIFLFLSLYEGFGIPPLEAMACGTPVIASNVTSIPEVVGTGGLIVDPKNSKQTTEAICKILTNKKFYSEIQQEVI